MAEVTVSAVPTNTLVAVPQQDGSVVYAFRSVAGDAEDAARYRWLRDSKRLGHWRVQQWQVETGEFNPDAGSGAFETLQGEALDQAIDEARADPQEGAK